MEKNQDSSVQYSRRIRIKTSANQSKIEKLKGSVQYSRRIRIKTCALFSIAAIPLKFSAVFQKNKD